MLSRIVTSIKYFCQDNLLYEKWLIAPSLRIGYQWLEQVAMSGQPVMNAHVKTIKRIVLDIASPYMDENDLKFLTGIQAEILAYDIFSRLENEIVYLGKLNLSGGLVQTILNSIYDLRLAGISSDTITHEKFEVPQKGMDIKILMSEYERVLKDNRLADYADVLRIACDRINNDSSSLTNDILLLLPENIRDEMHGLEHDFWQMIPAGIQKILDVDKPNDLADCEKTNASMLSFILNPGIAPEPEDDGSVGIFRSKGEVNEIRGIFRQCMEHKIPFDDVEVLYTDGGTYLPLIYELALQYETEEKAIPVTFAEGIPIYYSHPVRALLGLLSWQQENYLQSTLVKMLQDRLLILDKDDRQNISSEKLVTQLRPLPIGVGRERYEKAIEREIRSKDEESLKILQNLIRSLFECLPEDNKCQNYLAGIKIFLNSHARCSGKFDEYCREMLVGKIDELIGCLKLCKAECFDVREWLYNIIQTSKAGGQGPRAGCIYAAPVFGGGHSGRKHTFIVGLDDSRFPGSGRQDPLLLDHERDKISPGMPTPNEHLSKTVERFATLLAGLRGNVMLSYSCYDMNDDSAKFASSVLLSAFRIVSGNHSGDQTDLLKWLPDPDSFSPSHEKQCANIDEWWLHHLCGQKNISNLRDIVTHSFPNLDRGLKAVEARESDVFTHYDGYVPEAGPDHDPTRSDYIAVSASMLETLGRCPLEFFFKYVLRIKPPDEYVYDPAKWLNPLDKGNLLHSVFYEFMTGLKKSNELPNFEDHKGLLDRILENYISQYEAKFVPPSRDIFEKEKKQLSDTVRIFLQEEEKYCRQYRPEYFEVSIGGKADGEGSPLDSPDPIKISISNSKSIFARGRIDRMDRISDSNEMQFRILDYKTGSSYKYKDGLTDPFAEGRVSQNILYVLLAETHLRNTVAPDAKVSGFGYFFPNYEEHGHRIEWETGALAEGKTVLENLCWMIASGCFPHSNNYDDVKYSDYMCAFGNAQKNIGSIKKKMENADNKMLAPFLNLRPDKKKS